MWIHRMRLQSFRNIGFADLALAASRVFVLGPNGQGKSNLLEAVGLLTAFRSFRTHNLHVLPRREDDGAFTAVYETETPAAGTQTVELGYRRGDKRIEVDGESCQRLADFIGRFPVVALSADDLNLIRGAPAGRRRLFDLTLSATDRDYFAALRSYHRSVAERNRLLKTGGTDAECNAFETQIAAHARTLIASRAAGIQTFDTLLKNAYNAFTGQRESPCLRYRSETYPDTPSAYQAMLAVQRDRDRMIGTTRIGPHRDDLVFELDGVLASDFASDGQQRALCLALRMAQCAYLKRQLGQAPLLLVDDVLGELDPERTEGFWRSCPDGIQIIASGTRMPEAEVGWQVVRAEGGRFSLDEGMTESG